MKISLANLDKLHFTDIDGGTYIGGSQKWYEKLHRKASGCGPVSASNLIWYMSRMCDGMEGYLELINEMYTLFAPGAGGIHSSGLFTSGIARYGEKHGLNIDSEVLDIPARHRDRPGIGTVVDFISTALQKDAPLAFLLLSNGTLKQPESWHWVTIIALETDTMQVEISDYGMVVSVNISEWLKTSLLGGALVYLSYSAWTNEY